MDILKIIFSILFIPMVGYFAARSKYLSENECDSISKFVFTFVTPSLLFIGTANATFPENMAWEFLFTYYVTVLFVYLLSVVIGKMVFGYTDPEQSVFGMGASYSNIVVVGIPVCVYTLGNDSLLPLFIIISMHNLAIFTMGILIAERSFLSFSSALQNFVNVLKTLVTSPITGSLIAGGIVNIFNIPIYEPLADAIGLMSKAAVPAALFVLGTSLNQYKIQGYVTPALVMVTLKVAIHPLLVWLLAFHVFSMDPLWASTALLIAAMPVGINVYIFSKKYQACEAPVATGIVVSTLGCVLPLSVLLPYVQSII